MYTATTSQRLARHGIVDTGSQTPDEPRVTQYLRDAVRLSEENDRLRQVNAQLTAAAESWIRLYEAALDRANAAAPTGSPYATSSEQHDAVR
jgi:hypothetical protein